MQQQRFPRWLSWIILGFLGYIIITGNIRRPDMPPAPKTQEHESASQEDYPKLAALMNGTRWKRAIDPTYKDPAEACAPAAVADDQLGNYAIIREEGSGEGAACGAAITVSVTLWNSAGKASKTIDDLMLTLGEQKDLDALIVGMRPGEERLLLLRPQQQIAAIPELKTGIQQALTVTRVDEKKTSTPPDKKPEN